MAVSNMAGAIGALLDILRLTTPVFFRSQVSNDELLKKLKLVLLSFNPVLDVAEEKQFQIPAVKLWLEEFKDAFYHVEDLMDELLTEDLRDRLDADSQTKRSSAGKLRSSHMKGIERKTKEILERLDYIAMDIDRLGLRETISGYDMKNIQSRLSTSFLDQYGVFGRDHDKELIMRNLLPYPKTGEQLSVIAIVGMGGIGKTTLAQLIYNDHRVSEWFELKAWICVSTDFDMFRVTKAIFESLTSQQCDLRELNLLQVRLQEIVHTKKILLVLDDVWNDNRIDWEILQAPLKVAANGSCIIVTTRLQSVPEAMNAVCAHHLKQLSLSESWLLFKKIAFRDQNHSSNPELEVIGQEIVKKCHGLPLAVKSVAGLLCFKGRVQEWRAVLECLTYFPTEVSDIFYILRLSYDNLPAHLKRCFAYCSIFPKGYEFEKEKLVLLWMAEGLLQQPGGNHRMEDVGGKYFHELLSMSFFEQSSSNKSRFMMHDLISDLANFVSGRFCFRLQDDDHTDLTASIRYLSLFRCKYESPEIFGAINKARYLRTFLPLDHESCHLSNNELQNLLSRLQFLRVLSLSHYRIGELPDSIGNLKHLRYIDLSHTTIKSLPESVCALCNLQTLILSYCQSLTELPENMWKLNNLRHLDISGTDLIEMPKEISRLKNLQTLSYFIVGKRSGSTVKELGGLLYLHGTLCISKLQNVVHVNNAAEASLAKKTYLDELTFEWGDNNVDLVKDRDVLEQLVPHTNLKKLTIKFYGNTMFPSWLGDVTFSNMVFLCLSNCKYCLSLPPLGQLPSLKVLIIEAMNAVERVGPEFCGKYKPFPSLETLTFEGMLGWKEWVPFEVEFHCLRELCIRRCPRLTGQLPKQLPSVVKVEIAESKELVNILMMEASLQKKLHYHDKVLFTSDNKAVSFSEQMTTFLHEGGLRSPLPVTQGATGEVASISEDVTVISVTSYDISSTSSENVIKNPNTNYEGALKSSLPLPQTTNNRRDEADVLKDTWDSQDGLQDLSSSVSKKVSEISQLMNLPPDLHSLKIEGCDAEFISEAVRINRLPLLQHMYIINCFSLKSYPGGRPPTSMKSLYIHNCKKLEFLPPAEMTHQYAVLEHLCIGNSCDSLTSFPLGFFPKLRSLSLWDCANLVSLSMPEGIQKDLRALESLEIRDCPKLESFPGGLPTPSLKSIWFSNCKNLKNLPDQLHTLNSLQSMFINNCPELVSLPDEGLPSNLILLSITSCDKLMLGMEWGLDRLHHLSRLEIEGGCANVVSFPEKFLPRNLNSLRIGRLLNLKFLDKGLQHLTTLKTLEISCCNRLRSLAEEGLPSSLSSLCIKECSLLKSKLQNKAGKDWSKIAHISRIEIN